MVTPSALDAPRRLEVSTASGDALDVRQFHVSERMNELFEVTIVALSENADLDLEAIAGHPMAFTARSGDGELEARTWTGVCSHVEQIAVEDRGLSTYKLVLVPLLWLLTQRRNQRMFQLQSEVEIARKLLGEWRVPSVEKLSRTYKKRKYVVQYGETDFTFLARILEEAGVSFYFRTGGGATSLVLHDAPQSNPPRPPIAFRDNPTVADREHVTEVRVGRRVRPGKVTVRDHDYRRPPAYDLRSSARAAGGVEESLESFHYLPGAFLYESDKGEPSPVADDRGRYRTDEKEAAALAERRLAATRAEARTIAFDTSVIDLAPGGVASFLDHPRSELAPGKGFLVTASTLSGRSDGRWSCTCEATSAQAAYHPPLVTPKPRTTGVESATVVGPPGEEIHTDEFGRVRVHFHWDRESQMNERSSCWIHVSQPWSGSGFGGTNLPRVGQEVIVDFIGGDPDRPIIVGRVYTNLQKTPYKLPDMKTQSGWQSRSSPGGGASNYNELMFEDRKGQELVRMQAEKDLDKLVKNDEKVKIGRDRAKEVVRDDALEVGHDRTRRVANDETVTIGHDRTRQVVHDEAVTIGHDRTRQVANDETVSVGHDRTRQVANDETVSVGRDRTRQVGADESITIGKNRTKSVAVNESLFVGANQNEQVGASRTVKVGKNHKEKIGANKSVKIGKAKTETVALASAETVGLAKALTVGAAYKVTVGGTMSTTVAMTSTEEIGVAKTVVAGQKIEVVCGRSRLVLEQAGKITWEITGGAKIVLDDKNVNITAGEGGTVVIQGGPEVHVNP